MDPPLRSPRTALTHLSRVEVTPHTSFTAPKTTSASSPFGTRHDQTSVMEASNQQASLPSSHDMLGQFSFAPATQTTVVTTTTTTTTSFPPLLMKGPHHLRELDPKLYPLASSPTPLSIKRLCFDIGGRPAFFHEADNALETFQEVRPPPPSNVVTIRTRTNLWWV